MVFILKMLRWLKEVAASAEVSARPFFVKIAMYVIALAWSEAEHDDL